MPAFSPGDVVKLPFPDQAKLARQYRPALVVSSSELQELHGLLWVLMITSARNKPWAGDVEVIHPAEAGLPAPSVIRCAKIIAIGATEVIKIGTLGPAQLRLAGNMLHRALGIPPG